MLCLPASASDERKLTLVSYGAELVLTDPERRMLAAMERAEELERDLPAFYPNQFSNPANPRVHYETTGPELWRDMGGDIDVFVYGSGTGGTITGVGRYLKEQDPKVQVVAVEPARSAVISGGERGQHEFQGMGPGFIPDNLHLEVLDDVRTQWEEDAFALAPSARPGGGSVLGHEFRRDCPRCTGRGPRVGSGTSSRCNFSRYRSPLSEHLPVSRTGVSWRSDSEVEVKISHPPEPRVNRADGSSSHEEVGHAHWVPSSSHRRRPIMRQDERACGVLSCGGRH